MTHTQLAKRVAYWCGKLHLDPWKITTSIVEDPHHARENGRTVAASVRTAADYLKAEIEFAQDWVDANPSDDERDQTIVHELLHCLFRDLDNSALSVSDALGAVAESFFEERYRHELEQLIDRLAWTIVQIHGN